MIDEIESVNKKLKYKFDMKWIKKECMKNMIEGPPLKISSTIQSDTG